MGFDPGVDLFQQPVAVAFILDDFLHVQLGAIAWACFLNPLIHFLQCLQQISYLHLGILLL